MLPLDNCYSVKGDGELLVFIKRKLLGEREYSRPRLQRGIADGIVKGRTENEEELGHY